MVIIFILFSIEFVIWWMSFPLNWNVVNIWVELSLDSWVIIQIITIFFNFKNISLYSCDKSEVKEEPSVRPKARKWCRMAAAPKRRVKPLPSESGSSKTVEHKPLQRTLSTFRWRSSPDVVEESLIGMSFTISGTLDCLTSEDVIEMIETCGGTV